MGVTYIYVTYSQFTFTGFRDMTAVPLLLQAYSLFHGFPRSSVSLESGQKIKQHIVAALQAYTTPVMKLGEESEEELRKSIWTRMVSEVLKYVTYSFVFINHVRFHQGNMKCIFYSVIPGLLSRHPQTFSLDSRFCQSCYLCHSHSIAANRLRRKRNLS